MGQGIKAQFQHEVAVLKQFGGATMPVGAETCGMAENRMLYSSATSTCLCACQPACQPVLILGSCVLRSKTRENSNADPVCGLPREPMEKARERKKDRSHTPEPMGVSIFAPFRIFPPWSGKRYA